MIDYPASLTGFKAIKWVKKMLKSKYISNISLYRIMNIRRYSVWNLCQHCWNFIIDFFFKNWIWNFNYKSIVGLRSWGRVKQTCIAIRFVLLEFFLLASKNNIYRTGKTVLFLHSLSILAIYLFSFSNIFDEKNMTQALFT